MSVNGNRIVHISDLHFGNPLIPMSILHGNLRKYFYPYIEKCDLLVISGDIFHMLLHMDNNAVRIAIDIMLEIMTLADKYNVTVRVLRGTYFHDREQCKLFVNLHNGSEFKNDLKYYDSVSVEYIDKLDLKVLYLPDDLPYKNATEVINVAKSLMKQNNMSHVDLCIGHGVLSHILEPVGIVHAPKIVYDESMFDFVKGLVLFGHIHIASNYKGKYYYAGSFDRGKHKEEAPKGFWYFDKGNPTFIKNKEAIVFKTIDYSNYNTVRKELTDDFIDKLDKHKDDSLTYIRTVVPTKDIGDALGKLVKDSYPNIKYTFKALTRSKIAHADEMTYTEEVDITPDNLPMLLSDYIANELQSDIPISKEYIQELFSTL